MKQTIIAIAIISAALFVVGYVVMSDEYAKLRVQQSPVGNAGMMHQGEGIQITSEREFINQMVPHHQEAIATAQEVLERGGTTPGMVELAENIIASQTKEVEFMKTSYQEWYGTPYKATGEYRPMMRELADFEGEQLDLIFLHDMTMHHMGAIAMSRALKPHVEHESMRELAINIVINQTREIQTMRQLYQEIRSVSEEKAVEE